MENRSGIWSRMFLRLRRHLSFYSLSSGGSSSCARDAVTVSTRNAHNAGFKGLLDTGYYVPRILSAIGGSLTPFGQESYRPNIETYSRSCWLENHLHRFGTYSPEEESQPTISRISGSPIVYDLNSTVSSGSTSTISLGRSSSSGETRYFNNLGISLTDCNQEVELTVPEAPPPYTEEHEDPPPPYTESPNWIQPSVRTPDSHPGGFTEHFQDQSLY